MRTTREWLFPTNKDGGAFIDKAIYLPFADATTFDFVGPIYGIECPEELTEAQIAEDDALAAQFGGEVG